MKKLVYLLILAFVSTLTHAQVKIGANPGTIGSSSNLEVESTNGNKTIVDKATGQVTIQDGSQGASKVLTSDANGASSWQPLATQTSTVMVSVTSTVQSLPANTFTTVDFTGKIFDKGNDFDLTTNRLNIPSTGYYIVTMLGAVDGSSQSPTAVYGHNYAISKNGTLYRYVSVSQINGQSGSVGSGTVLLYAVAGDYITATVYSNALASKGSFILDAYKVSN